MQDIEELWGDLLSREPSRVVTAWKTLALNEQHAVLSHLERMTSEEGWAEVQRQSAEAALTVLRELQGPCDGAPGP